MPNKMISVIDTYLDLFFDHLYFPIQVTEKYSIVLCLDVRMQGRDDRETLVVRSGKANAWLDL